MNNTFSYYVSVVNGRYTVRWKEIQDCVIVDWQQKAFHTCYYYDWTNGEKKIFLSCYVTENYWWCKRIRLFCERKRKERRLNFNWFCCDLSIIFSTSHWHFKIFINFFVILKDKLLNNIVYLFSKWMIHLLTISLLYTNIQKYLW